MSTILVLCPYVPHPPTHGGSLRTRVLLEALRAAGERADADVVHVVVPVADEAARATAKAFAQAMAVRVHEVAVPALPRPDFARKLRSWSRGRSELLLRRWGEGAGPAVAGIAASLRPDLVVVDSSFVLPIVPRAPVPQLLHLHNLESSVFARAGAAGRGFAERVTRAFEARTIAAAERQALRTAAAVVTVSEVDRALALALAPGANVVAVPNSVDLERLPLLPPPSPPSPPRLLFVGTLDYPPNLEAVRELVFEHLPVLRAAFPGLVVRLVGRDDGGALAAFRGHEGVEAVGPVDDLLPHYRDSHAVYLPIRSGGGTRIKILEAWALGRPVLATAVGAEGLGGGDGVHWRQFESPQQGVAALRDVLAGQTATLVANARRFVAERYSHTAAVAALRAVVRSLLNRR